MYKNLYFKYKEFILLGLISIIIGLIVGIIDTFFGKILISITEFRQSHFIILIPFLSLVGLFIIYIYNKIGKNTISGMSLVFESAQNEKEDIPKRLIILSIITTWLTHLFGGSAGREGVAVQIGAAISDNVSKLFKIKNKKRIFIVAGMAAGFSGLFQTPIAAVFFALEVLFVGALQYDALYTSILAAFTASYTSHFLGLEKFSYKLSSSINLDFILILKLCTAGLVFGIVGRLFAHLLGLCKKYFNRKFDNPLIKIFIIGVILSILLTICHVGRYSGLGTNLINNSFYSKEIYSYDWALKFIFTILTLSAGFQGGEVTPLFSIGSSLGVVLAVILNLPIEFVSALGYCSVFGAATNTFLAPMFIGAEVFGYEFLPYFFVTCCISYIINGNKTIYTLQKQLFTE